MNNLKQFTKYDVYGKTKEISKNINLIDELMKLKIYNYIPLEARKILEILLVKEFDEKSLGQIINDFKNRNRKEVPKIIYKSMMFIKNKGNDAAHALNSEKRMYELENDIYSSIEIIKQLFKVLKYFVELTDPEIDISKIKFDISKYQVIGSNTKQLTLTYDDGTSEDIIVGSNRKYSPGNTSVYMGEKHSLKRLLNTVGKKNFVTYYEEFNSDSYLPNITKDGSIKIGSAKAMKSSANKIFEFGMEKEALEQVAYHARVDYKISMKAQSLLKKYFK